MKDFIQKLVEKRDLDSGEARDAMKTIMSGNATDAQIAGFLIALRMKGETPEEIASMVNVMREFADTIKPKVNSRLVDTCGTGGDKIKTFNISTTVMFIVAGAGIPIAKHGNRSVSSKCGSADVLEALGIKIEMEPKKVEECIEKVGIGFMFAPTFHKAMKYVMPARKQLGVRTIFNVLGPLTNPANAKGQIVGIFDSDMTEKIAEVLKLTGLERGFVVHGMDGLDEISTIGETKVSELYNEKIETYYIKPEDFGIKRARVDDILGFDAITNAKIMRDILYKKETGPKKDIVLLNAAAGIVAGGKADTLDEGMEIAKESLDSGRASKKLEDLIKFCS